MKPVLVVSKCLGFGRCRYDGGTMSDPTVEGLKGRARFIPVCPEMGIGLGVPRDPVRIVLRRGRRALFQPASDRDLTRAMRRFCAAFHAGLKRVDGYILKARSPSCGVCRVKVYRSLKGRTGRDAGIGFFAASARRFRPGIPIVDEERLKVPAARERFMARIFGRRRERRDPGNC